MTGKDVPHVHWAHQKVTRESNGTDTEDSNSRISSQCQTPSGRAGSRRERRAGGAPSRRSTDRAAPRRVTEATRQRRSLGRARKGPSG